LVGLKNNKLELDKVTVSLDPVVDPKVTGTWVPEIAVVNI
jgi:hypothetical protein